MISQGITDYELYADRNSDRIIVRFPWKSDDQTHDAVKAIQDISSTAELTFRPGNSYATTDIGSDGEYVYKTPTGDTEEVLMTGSSVEKAEAQYYTDNNGNKRYTFEVWAENVEFCETKTQTTQLQPEQQKKTGNMSNDNFEDFDGLPF